MEGGHINKTFDENQNISPPEYEKPGYQEPGGGHPKTVHTSTQNIGPSKPEYGNPQVYHNTNQAISSSNHQPMFYNPQMFYHPNQPVASYVPQVMQPPQPMVVVQGNGKELTTLKYRNVHLGFGIYFIVMGVIICVIDPLLPIFYIYFYSIMPAGTLLCISGILSVVGSRKCNKGCLIASMVLNIFVTFDLFPGFIVGIIYSQIFFVPVWKILGIFNAVFCSVHFILVIVDSAILCSDTCCGRKPPQTLAVAYSVPQNAPMTY